MEFWDPHNSFSPVYAQTLHMEHKKDLIREEEGSGPETRPSLDQGPSPVWTDSDNQTGPGTRLSLGLASIRAQHGPGTDLSLESG